MIISKEPREHRRVYGRHSLPINLSLKNKLILLQYGEKINWIVNPIDNYNKEILFFRASIEFLMFILRQINLLKPIFNSIRHQFPQLILFENFWVLKKQILF